MEKESQVESLEVPQGQETPSQEETPTSEVLSQEEVQKVLNDEELGTEPELPSDKEEVEIPEKFKGKSPEEIIKAYQELEKKLGQKEEPQEETQEEPETKPEVAVYEKFLDKVKGGEELSEEDYKELEEAGYNKQFVDQQVEFINYQKQKYVEEFLGDFGGIDTFKEAVAWAKENWTEEQIQEYNEGLNAGNRLAQKALVRSLIEEYQGSTKTETEPIHSNQPVNKPTKGYSSEVDFMSDISDPRYGNDPAYTKAVETKMSQTDTSNWVGFKASVSSK